MTGEDALGRLFHATIAFGLSIFRLCVCSGVLGDNGDPENIIDQKGGMTGVDIPIFVFFSAAELFQVPRQH